MDDKRFIEEQIKAYYYTAKTMLCDAKLGFFGMTSNVEKLLDSLYECNDIHKIDYIVVDFDMNFNKKRQKIDSLVYTKESVRDVVDRGITACDSLYNKQEIQSLLTKSLAALPTTGRMISHCFYRALSLKKKLFEMIKNNPELEPQDFGKDILDEKREEEVVSKKEEVEILDFDEETSPRIQLYDEAVSKLFDELEKVKGNGGDTEEVFNNFSKRLDEIDNEILN